MADSSVISDRRMAQGFSSFWQELAPMADAYIRSINLRKERLGPPLKSSLRAERRGLVNEFAFRLFRYEIEHGNKPNTAAEGKLATAVRQFIRSMPRMEQGVAPIGTVERAEARKLRDRLATAFVATEGEPALIVGPRFPGCGRMLPCEGDVLQGVTLWEVKPGERDFRVHDLRQLLLYSALNHVGRTYAIESIGILNPRSGVYVAEELSAVCMSIAGRTPNDIFEEIQQFLCMEVPSI
jgi:hypothetical protein